MVVHIVLTPSRPPEDAPDARPEPWPPSDPEYNVLADPRVSAAVKVWALLHVEPHSMPDILTFTGVRRCATVHAGVRRLRERGQQVVFQGGVYRLERSGPLEIVHIPHRGVILEPGGAKFAHLRQRIACDVHAGRPRIAVLEGGMPPEVVEEPSGPLPPWRPRRGPKTAPPYPGQRPRSVAVWVWGLLKGGAWTTAGLVDELGVHRCRIERALADLRKRGHRILCDTRERHFIAEDGRALRVIDYGGRLRLARLDGLTGDRDFELV